MKVFEHTNSRKFARTIKQKTLLEKAKSQLGGHKIVKKHKTLKELEELSKLGLKTHRRGKEVKGPNKHYLRLK